MAATLKDVARKVGVHPSTVSRVLSGKYDNFNVSKETRELILKTVKECNYVPNATARSLRLKKTQTIGLIIPDILNPLFAGIARSIGLACEKKNYSYIVCNTDESQDKELKYIEMLKNRGIDGMIIVPVQDRKEHIQKLKEENFPFVLVYRDFEDIETDAVITDNVGDSYKAVEYLIKLGHRRIAFIRGRRASVVTRRRELGYKKALNAYNIGVDEELIVGDGWLADSGYQATKTVLNLPERPTALLISSNVIIVGVLEAIFESGLLIPDEISVVGFAGMRATPYLSCSLTSVSHPAGSIGKRAFEMLLKQMESEKQTGFEKIVLPGKFIIGKSTQKALGS